MVNNEITAICVPVPSPRLARLATGLPLVSQRRVRSRRRQRPLLHLPLYPPLFPPLHPTLYAMQFPAPNPDHHRLTAAPNLAHLVQEGQYGLNALSQPVHASPS